MSGQPAVSVHGAPARLWLVRSWTDDAGGPVLDDVPGAMVNVWRPCVGIETGPAGTRAVRRAWWALGCPDAGVVRIPYDDADARDRARQYFIERCQPAPEDTEEQW